MWPRTSGVFLTLLTVSLLCAETVQIKNLKILCVIYRGDPAAQDHMDEHAVVQAKNGVELGRLFYFRNSRARLNCEVHWLVFDQPPPRNDGPTMEFIEAHLRAQGVRPGEYDGLFVTGVGLCGNFGGFVVLDGAGGCFGGHTVRGGLQWYPEDNPDVAYGTAWNFVHEFQHALDLVICENSGRKDMLHDHPYADRNEPYFKGYYWGGEHWDWVALCLREFDGYHDIKGVTRSVLECTDSDGDGLPDDDSRLPMDEKRFGSAPTKKDTDDDGLDDLAEFTADRYVGSNPRNLNTDGDGLMDGEDPYPVVPIAPTLTYDPMEPTGAAFTIPNILAGAFVRNDAGGEVSVGAAWNEIGLSFAFSGPRKFAVLLKIDGSATNGFWEGGDTYLIRISENRAVFDGLGLKGDVPQAHVASTVVGGTHYMHRVHLIATSMGQGVSKEINYGGARDPEDVVDGLTLVEGRSIAFNFIFEFEDQTRAVLTPHHTMYAVKLVKPPDAAEVVLLRGPKETSAASPTVTVLGARPTSRVEIVTVPELRVVGARVGSGPVLLTGLTEDGTHLLCARTPNTMSFARELLIDRSAAPPTAQRTGQALTAVCEPNAEFELWWGLNGLPVAPLGGARADENGRVEMALGDALGTGWVVTGYRGRFEQPVFVEAWDRIDRSFEDRAPDGRLPADGFSYRCEGYLQIETPGRYGFELSSDDGSRLWIDDELAINHWGQHGMSPNSAKLELSAGLHRARLEYYELDGWAGLKLRYAPGDGELTTNLPVRRLPLPINEVEFFGLQVDRLGNRSGFATVGPPAPSGEGK